MGSGEFCEGSQWNVNSSSVDEGEDDDIYKDAGARGNTMREVDEVNVTQRAAGETPRNQSIFVADGKAAAGSRPCERLWFLH